VKRIHNFIRKANKAIDAANRSAKPRIKHPDTQGKRGAIPPGDEAAALCASVMVKLKVVHNDGLLDFWIAGRWTARLWTLDFGLLDFRHWTFGRWIRSEKWDHQALPKSSLTSQVYQSKVHQVKINFKAAINNTTDKLIFKVF
jgi:hypothetical protein